MKTGPLSFTAFEGFVRRLYRRRVLLRATERTGLGLLGGAALALVAVLPVFWWQGRPTVAPSLASLGVGALLGFASASVRRPRPLAVAAEADRQLGLSDLLGTALTQRAAAVADSWSRTVLAQAESRCQRLSPGAVVLSRLGPRAWGGIGLAAGLVVTLAPLGDAPAAGRAAAQAATIGISSDAGSASAEPPDRPLLAAGDASRSAPPERDNDATDDAHPGLALAQLPKGGDPTAADGAPEDPSTGTQATAAQPTGGANGAGRTDAPDRGNASPQPARANSGAAATAPVPPPGRAATGGPGRATDAPADTSPDSAAAGGTGAVAPGPPRRAAPPWRGDGWPADVARANAALDAGQVPAAYRDVVRKYFERD